MNENPWFHVQDGLTFEKLSDDKIRIWIAKDGKADGEEIFSSTISKDAMASVMAFLSNSGDNAKKWEEARNFFSS